MVESCSNYFRYPLNGDFRNTSPLYNGQDWRKTWYPFTLQRTFFRQKAGFANVKFWWTAFARYQVLSLIRNFKGQKSTVMRKFLWKDFSLYLLGHLQEKNQRSKNTFHWFGISEGWNSTAYEKSSKNSVHLLQVLARCVLADFWKIIFFCFLPRR